MFYFWPKSAFKSQKTKIFVNRNPLLSAIQSQFKLGEIQIADIVIDPKSRDDIPQLLRGQQYI